LGGDDGGSKKISAGAVKPPECPVLLRRSSHGPGHSGYHDPRDVRIVLANLACSMPCYSLTALLPRLSIRRPGRKMLESLWEKNRKAGNMWQAHGGHIGQRRRLENIETSGRGLRRRSHKRRFSECERSSSPAHALRDAILLSVALCPSPTANGGLTSVRPNKSRTVQFRKVAGLAMANGNLNCFRSWELEI
jgi:hypothetical protein